MQERPNSLDPANSVSYALFMDAGYPRHCELCPPSLVIPNRLEFVYHLRQVHCTKEGGSFVCRYGPNGICQSLPLEGVSDRDYELHIRRDHANAGQDPKLALYPPGKSEDCDDGRRTFTIHSFTQNLSSALSDPRRSRFETMSFFTRHWGESFAPRHSIEPSPSLPAISLDHFRRYLTTTAVKHRRYLRAKMNLNRKLERHGDGGRVDVSDIPTVLLDSHFSLADPATFEAIFLEPSDGMSDHLRMVEFMSGDDPCLRPGSATFAAPSTSEKRDSDVAVAYPAGNGRFFRTYESLQNLLEYYHDLVDSRLNNQLASKSNAFWKTVISYGGLHGDLASARENIACVRQNLQKINDRIYERIFKLTEVHRLHEQRKKLLSKLQDMACLRDAQLTVQVLLNQNDYPKALECIETAQDVLNSDLRDIVCFRHMNSQLQELYKVIRKMLREEFIAVLKKEINRPCETEADTVLQEGQLIPVVLGLLRLEEYSFIQILQQEITEAMKNLTRQVMKTHVEKNRESTSSESMELSRSLSAQMLNLSFTEWMDALEDTITSFHLMIRRVQSVEELMRESLERSRELLRSASGNTQQRFLEQEESSECSELLMKQINDEVDDDFQCDSLPDLCDDVTADFERSTSLPKPSSLTSTPVTDTESHHSNTEDTSAEGCWKSSTTPAPKLTACETGMSPSPSTLLSLPCRTLASVCSSHIKLFLSFAEAEIISYFDLLFF
ncbi:hypothetical protein AB6A40_009754 [Gnathostoma spinigerum]|uniref:Vacuolar protein sorting-associated protein 54 N-terminal domain-containing protein n=1 Tax=Gnathostoma spinigerum TaxID=75299 RepID=A0ABD6ESV5_9BILA